MKHYKDADEILRRLPDDLPYKASVRRVLMQAPDADVVEVEQPMYKIKFTDGMSEHLLSKADMSGYESPINIALSDVRMAHEKHIEGEVFRVIREVGVTVDKEELLKALRYDRQQYEKGYIAGYAQRESTLETVNTFQCRLRKVFISMCGGNDYSKLNLLQIDQAIESLFDTFVEELKEKYLEGKK